MTWFYATSVSVTNGQTVVSVNTGDDIVIAQEQGGLIIGTNPPVEIKRTYLDGSSNKKIELSKPWPYGSQTNQPAMAFPTDGDLAAATAVLKQLIDGFALATQADAQAGIENTKPMTALRVKQAMDVLLGTASKLNATTSTADGTLGRALRVGDFGVGVSASTDMRVTSVVDSSVATDLNGFVKPGWLKVLVNGNISTNAPPLTAGGTGYWYLQVIEYNAGEQVQQRAHSYDVPIGGVGSALSPPQLFLRTRYNGVWSAWAQASAPAVGQVAFTSGVNTGAIIERGSNANGEYIRFADGTMICTGKPSVIANQLSNNNVGVHGWSYYYENNSVQFPATFIAAPNVDVTPQGAFLSAMVLSTSATSFVVTPVTTISITAGAPIMFTAIGRWRA